MTGETRAHGILGTATKYGLIQGALAFGVFLAQLAGIKQSWAVSAFNIALLIVLMALAHWEIKRTHEGRMTYAQGLGSGTLLSSAGALVSCVLVYLYVRYINSGYFAAVAQAQRDALAQRGITGEQAQQAVAMTAAIRTPLGIALTTLIAGLIVGFIVALIVSIFTQKPDPRAVV